MVGCRAAAFSLPRFKFESLREQVGTEKKEEPNNCGMAFVSLVSPMEAIHVRPGPPLAHFCACARGEGRGLLCSCCPRVSCRPCAVKLFKFLDWHPQLTILLTTLAVSARPLAWFMLTFIIVLVGNAQAFFIAFQTDVPEFSTAFGSISSLMRMALGDFDYNALDTSNAVMGPILFWIYIFLVFFVLMSMFIALVSESYESVYDESKKKVYLPRGSTRSGFGTWVNAIDEAVRRVIMARDLGLISHRMRGDLDEFCEAVDENIRGKFVLEEVKRHRRTSLEGLRPQSESLQKLGEMAQTGSQDQDEQRLRAQTRKFMKDHPEHATAERLGCCGVMARCMNRASSKKLWNEDGFERRLGIAEGIESEGHPRYLAVADSTDPDEVFGGPRASWLSFRKGDSLGCSNARDPVHD